MGFTVNGLDEFSLSLKEAAELPNAVQDDMLEAGAAVVAKAQRDKVMAYGIYDRESTQHVADSIKPGKVKLKKGERVIYVSPTGKRKRGNTETRNAEILFVNEFGKKGQSARPAVHDANEASAEATTRAEFEVYDRWLKSKNL